MAKPEKTRRSRARRFGVVLVLVVAVGVGGWAALAGAEEGETGPGARIAATPVGPERLLRAYGLTASSGQEVFRLRNGDEVSIVLGTDARCLVLSAEGRPAGETCAGNSGLAEGHGISVHDECGSAGANRMEIVGLAPEGSDVARLDYSDGSSAETEVQSGAFRFEGLNPRPGEPYPTRVEWLSGGSSTGGAELPVGGDEFCPQAG